MKQPNEYTADQVLAQLIAIKEQLVVIESEAPEMRSRHLRRMKEDAESKGQEKWVAGIKLVIKREESAGRHRNVGLTTKKRKGGGKVFKVERADADSNIITYCTKEDVEAVAGQTIDERYCLAYSAPIMHHPQLVAEQILNGTYVFPPDTEP
jgi:hypothetical protein